jgi:hypothetical protein
MKNVLVVTTLLSFVALTGCTKHEQLSTNSGDTTQRVSTQTNGEAVNAVAGDKELLRQAIVLADSKGTLQAALTEAAQDSVVGPKMRAAIVLSGEAKGMTTPPPSGKTSSNTSKSKSGKPTAQSKGDALDQANSGLDKANQTVTKSGQVIDKTQEVGNKIGDILNRRK